MCPAGRHIWAQMALFSSTWEIGRGSPGPCAFCRAIFATAVLLFKTAPLFAEQKKGSKNAPIRLRRIGKQNASDIVADATMLKPPNLRAAQIGPFLRRSAKSGTPFRHGQRQLIFRINIVSILSASTPLFRNSEKVAPFRFKAKSRRLRASSAARRRHVLPRAKRR